MSFVRLPRRESMTVSPDHGSVCGVSFAAVSLLATLFQYQPYAMATSKDALPVGSTENPYSTPQESPDSGAPRRSNQNQFHRCSLSGWSVLLLDSQASEGSPPVEPGSDEHQGDRRQSGRQRVGNIHARSCKRAWGRIVTRKRWDAAAIAMRPISSSPA